MWLQLTNQNDQAINTDHVRRFKRVNFGPLKEKRWRIAAVYNSGDEVELLESCNEVERDNKYHELLKLISAVDW